MNQNSQTFNFVAKGARLVLVKNDIFRDHLRWRWLLRVDFHDSSGGSHGRHDSSDTSENHPRRTKGFEDGKQRPPAGTRKRIASLGGIECYLENAVGGGGRSGSGSTAMGGGERSGEKRGGGGERGGPSHGGLVL